MTEKAKILIDCDPGHDDAVALLFAARHLDLSRSRPFTATIRWPTPPATRSRSWNSPGIDVPVAAGCSEPLVQGPGHAGHIHGKTGLDGADIPAPTRRRSKCHAVDLIIELASRHRGELVVALIGPQTNFAVALKREPRLKEWVREVTIMGGSTGLGNITPVAEFNVSCDPEAASVVFESGIPIRMVGYNVTRQTGFDAGDLARLKASGRKMASVIGDLMGFYLAGQNRVFGLSVAPMHDVCAIVPYVAPGLIRYVETSVKVELAGVYTRGMTVCDLRGLRPDAPAYIRPAEAATTKVALEADSRPLIDLVVDAVLGFA